MDKNTFFKFFLAALLFPVFLQNLHGQSDSLRFRQHWDHAPTHRQRDSTKMRQYRNELGTDATALVMQVLHLTEPQFGGYSGAAEYYLTYRRYFKPGNIRAAIGGYYSASPIQNTQIDTGEYYFIRRAMAVRAGWEFCSELSKRWQAFYGLDVLFSGEYYQNDWIFSNGGYQNGRIDILKSIGLGPILGFRFRLNPRLSLSTETRFSIHRLQDYHRQWSVPIDNPLPLLPDEITDVKSWRTEFAAPTSLFFTFSF